MRYIPTIATTATLPFKDRNCSPSTPSHRPQHATDTSAKSAKLHHISMHNQFPTVLRTGRAPRGSCARRRSAQEVGNQEKTAREAASRLARPRPWPTTYDLDAVVIDDESTAVIDCDEWYGVVQVAVRGRGAAGAGTGTSAAVRHDAPNYTSLRPFWPLCVWRAPVPGLPFVPPAAASK